MELCSKYWIPIYPILLCTVSDNPPPRKRQQSTPSKCEHTDELQSNVDTLGKVWRCGLGVVQEVTRIRDDQHPIQHDEIVAAAAIISHNIF
jgi:hypothetical protein